MVAAWRAGTGLLAGLLLWLAATSAWAVHFDVELRTSGGPVAGSRITTAFFGDLGLPGLPIDGVTGYKIFPGYFGDLEGGPLLTDDPGFQAFAGTFLRGEEIHFRALGTLQHWNPDTGRWGPAPPQVQVALFGGIPTEVIVGYTENPAVWQALYDYHAAGTRFKASGIEGPATAMIDDASSSGAFHAHLDWQVSAAGGTVPVGAYMVTLELWSPALQANGQAKYLPSAPIQVVFERGTSEAQMQAAIAARVNPPPPACAAGTLSWLVEATGCSATVAETASGNSVIALDIVEPALGSARFSCSAGTWGSAANATCAVPPPQPCTSQVQEWSVAGQQCSAATAAAASGESAVATDTSGPALGSAVFTCTNGRWGTATAATCAVPPPAACSAAVLGWSVAGQACSAAVAGAEPGTTVLASDTEEPNLGSARYTCSNGSWGNPAEAVCAAPPPPRPCPAAVLNWAVAGAQCSANVAGATSGQSVAAADAEGPAVGSAVFACSNGSWGAATAASCAVPPPADCGATLAAWTVQGHACSTALPTRPSGSSVLASDDEAPNTGSARFACSNGSWSPPTAATCSPPPPPLACTAQTLGWQQAGEQCSAAVPASTSGQSVVAADEVPPLLGSAVFACSNGVWGAPGQAACRPRVAAACPAQPVGWATAGIACNASLPATASGLAVQVQNSQPPNSGSALYSCQDGLWSAPTAATCTAPPPARPCVAQALSWRVGNDACAGTAATTESGLSASVNDEEAPTVGSAVFACSNGTWGAAAAARCTVPPPAACSATVASWNEDGLACSAPLAEGASGSVATATDNTEPHLGSASFSCTNGRWGAPMQPRCAAPPPPRPCVAQELAWQEGPHSCQAWAAGTASGASAVLGDVLGPTLGSAAFTCSNGSWGAAAAARCATPPPRACAAQQLSWTVGPQTCQGPAAAAAAGQEARVQAGPGALLGSARFTCHDGTWQRSPGQAASCSALAVPQPRGRLRAPWAPPNTLPWQGP